VVTFILTNVWILRASYLRETSSIQVLPGIVFGGNRPFGFISVAACCCHSRGWMTFMWCFFPSHSSFPFGHKWRPC